MITTDPNPRIPQVSTESLTDDMKEFLSHWTGGIFSNADTNPVLTTIAHHPHLAHLFSQLNIHILSTNTVPVRLRQIAIMRTAWLCKATYMWSSHLRTSQRCGLETELFEPIKNGASDPYFNAFEKDVILATEELLYQHKICEQTWDRLMAQWSYQQVLDFMFTVGIYTTMSGVMNSSQIQRAPNLLELAATYGAP